MLNTASSGLRRSLGCIDLLQDVGDFKSRRRFELRQIGLERLNVLDNKEEEPL